MLLVLLLSAATVVNVVNIVTASWHRSLERCLRTVHENRQKGRLNAGEKVGGARQRRRRLFERNLELF